MKFLPAVALLLLVSSIAAAQKEKPPCAEPAKEAKPCSDSLLGDSELDAPAAPAGTLATLDGKPIAASDLPGPARQAWEGRQGAVATARREALRFLLDDRLLKLEAAKRKTTPKELWYSEVVSKVGEPSAAEIDATIAGRPERFRSPEGRAIAAGVATEKRERERARAFFSELDQRYQVTVPVDVAAEPLPAGTIATIGGTKLTAKELAPELDAAAADARTRSFSDLDGSLEELIDTRLVEAEAASRKLTKEQLLSAEVESKIARPTEADLRAHFTKNRRLFPPDFESSQEEIAWAYFGMKKGELEKELYARLRKGHTIRKLVTPPTPIARKLPGGGHARGDAKSKALLVEWGDFQCPPCGRVAELLEEVLPAYGDRVRSVFHHAPLRIHPFAQKAAEAALAADAQGKFFPYAKLLFERQRALAVPDLVRYAGEIGLDVEKFRKDLESGRFAKDVAWERRLGKRVGVRGTPGLFLNGVPLEPDVWSPEELRKRLDAALAGRG